MHEEGVPLKVAQERLGHARAETTMTYYVHPRDEVGERAAETISRRVNGSRRRRKRSNRRNSVSRIVSRSGARRV